MQQKSFFEALFDFSFSSMITVRIIQILYALAMLGNTLITFFILLAVFKSSSAAGIIVLVLSPVIFTVMTIFVRVYMETLIVLFKIADNTAAMAESFRREPPTQT